MLYLFYITTGLLTVQGIFSLIDGLRFRAFVRRSLEEPFGPFKPKASIIAPCKGIDTALEENLDALFTQDYPDYEIIFAIASDADPARQVIERATARHPDRSARLIVAEQGEGRSEKVNNLLRALDHISPDSKVLVFVDSDARVGPLRLRALVSALSDGRKDDSFPQKEDSFPQAGAATGYRWYLPERGGFWSAMLSAWNGSVATMLGDHKNNFAWGGSTAITREAFERFNVAARWERAVSDDYALTRAVQDGGSHIKFVPRCLSVTREDPTFGEMMEFTTRQIIITRVYRPKVWWMGMISHLFFNATFWGGIIFVSLGGNEITLPLTMLSAIYVLGSMKGALRMAAAMDAIATARREILKLWWAYCFLWPLVSLLFLYNFIKSATTRRITWRGVRYEMRSPTETIVDGSK
ncbi:MAG: glycosyltransferase [Blastocatellia bacterium]|nr:glycosyltransferase [Blastocatellia bacterium]